MKNAIIASLLVLILSTVRPVDAHAFLDTSIPKVGSTITIPPTEVTILFDDDIQPDKSNIQVFDAAGKQLDKKDSHPGSDADDKTTLIVSLPAALAPGTYKVTWHATCVDNHKTEGSFQFTIKPAP
jgi:methionine-rich copper-binding protein CopC